MMISHVTVALLDIPQWGKAMITPGLTKNDREKVNKAAAVLGMSQNELARTAIVRVAERVLDEAGVAFVPSEVQR